MKDIFYHSMILWFYLSVSNGSKYSLHRHPLALARKRAVYILFHYATLICDAADVIKLDEDTGFSVHAYADDLQIYGHTDPHSLLN